MISQSEGSSKSLTYGVVDHGVLAGLPMDLSGTAWRDGGSVSRLRFETLEMGDGNNAERTDARPGAAESGTYLKEQIAALEVQMRFQRRWHGKTQRLRGWLAGRMQRRRDWLADRMQWTNVWRSLKKRMEAEREKVLQACVDFRLERQRYFASVEEEVVKLALAIAARVLHREAKIDPTMLTSAVRVALGRMQEDSGVVLRVSTEDEAMWREVGGVGDRTQVKVAADETMGAGECVLETNVGRVELGVSAQLEEIEKGFFDLLQRRPA